MGLRVRVKLSAEAHFPALNSGNKKFNSRPVVPTILQKKPFGENVEGLVSEKSRGDRTAIELFMAGVQGLDATIRGVLCQNEPGEDRASPRLTSPG